MFHLKSKKNRCKPWYKRRTAFSTGSIKRFLKILKRWKTARPWFFVGNSPFFTPHTFEIFRAYAASKFRLRLKPNNEPTAFFWELLNAAHAAQSFAHQITITERQRFCSTEKEKQVSSCPTDYSKFNCFLSSIMRTDWFLILVLCVFICCLLGCLERPADIKSIHFVGSMEVLGFVDGLGGKNIVVQSFLKLSPYANSSTH